MSDRKNVARLPERDTGPRDYDTEKALLAAILANNRVMEMCDERGLRPEHYADSLHGRIHDACSRLIAEGRPANPVSLRRLFDQDGALAEIGGAQYLVDLAQSVVTVLDAGDYAAVIVDLYTRREAINTATEYMARLRVADPFTSAAAIVSDFEARLAGVCESTAQQRSTCTINDALYRALEQADLARRTGGLLGLTTGLADLNRMTGGLQPGLTILAGRPAMGKSALAQVIADNAAAALAAETPAGKTPPCAIFYALEMNALQLGQRALSQKTGISTDRQSAGVSDQDFERLADAYRDTPPLPLIIDDSAKNSVASMATRARRLHQKRGVRLIITDHLQLIETETGDRAARDNAVQRMTAISRGLKILSKELNVPILALSQLSRAVEQRDDKRPQLADLRESGSIEQDADAVWMLYRPEYYLQQPIRKEGEKQPDFEQRSADYSAELSRVANTCDVLIRKNRMGRLGTVKLYCDLAASRFSDLAKGG